MRRTVGSMKNSPFASAPTFLDVGHSRVPHWRVGRGPDLLFIHGWPLHAATFRELVPRLSDRFTCHLIDLPGTGLSEWSKSSRIGLREHTETVRQVVDQLGLSRYGIVAHDSGAVIARYLAADDPRAAALVLGNSEIPGHRARMVELYVHLNKLPFSQALMALVLGIRWLRRSALGYGGCFHDLSYLDGDFHRLFVAPMLASPRIGVGQSRLLDDFDWTMVHNLDQVHARICAPAKLIWGADDPFFPLAKAEAMVGQFRAGATLSVLRPGKLLAHEEFPDAFVREARPFLEQQLAAEPARATAS